MAADAPDVRTLEVRGWLLRASEDLRAGRHDLTAVPPLLNDVAFHAQQCAFSIVLKGYLTPSANRKPTRLLETCFARPTSRGARETGAPTGSE